MSCQLQGAMAEAFDAWRKGRDDLGEELADVAIHLLGLAEMTGIDLLEEIEAKMARNAARVTSVCRTALSPGAKTTPASPLQGWGRFRAVSMPKMTVRPPWVYLRFLREPLYKCTFVTVNSFGLSAGRVERS
jgi:hypothetical protein